MLTLIDDFDYNGWEPFNVKVLYADVPKKYKMINDNIRDELSVDTVGVQSFDYVESYFRRMDIYLNAKANYFKLKAEFEC